MENTYWHRQTSEKPLFPDLLWSRPQSKQSAGKLAIIGGNAFAFGAPGVAYNEAIKSGIGICRVLLPDAVKKTVKAILPDADYASSNRSGSFSKPALDNFLESSNWSDGTLLAGDFGRNSETAVLLENFVQKYDGLLTITQDATDYFKAFPKVLLSRENTLIVVSLAQLQKIFINIPLITPITFGMSIQQLVEALHSLTEEYPVCISVKHHDVVYVAFDGRVITTPNEDMPWRVKTATRASVFWLQNPSKILEAATTSLTV